MSKIRITQNRDFVQFHHYGFVGGTQNYASVTKQPWYSGASSSLGYLTNAS